ncbi:PSD1 and planctomycete cytochrome C domain-containing protein [Rhodopirellula sp. P2]|uniref:PSD1 and planctomycete cytochrome C domain-containing protein n=1 Tax=Rhodopirellula sp. P2 TaxID=2127060 RepID=UPI0023679F2E|nr:PSD1 and planctomycete cytochrome C domain-containing protein [Rhodopirellula sp. P2]WDQ16472.1 PSD1 and planctomycete cytochrome C domain-containing protein [Rhodopirellula sp. P2]
MTFPFDRRFLFLAVCFGLLNSVALGQDTDNSALNATSSTQPPATRSTPIDFVREIQPILRDNCFECHAGTTEEGGLNLGIKTKALQGGDSEEAILAGKAEESLLIELVSGGKDNALMPPEGSEPLTETQVNLLRDWIDQGAAWPDDADIVDPKMDQAKSHWAFQRLQEVDPPSRSSNDNWSKGPIDLFVLRRLNDAGIRPSQPADARTLVRRLYFDLIGLPPTPEQTNQFIVAHTENSDLAIQHLVDELLDSPRYSERWARHWLDVARYADSDGQEADKDRPYAYHYRDFVIQAFNDDMPYDQFVRWQIAGDEIEPDNDAAVSATGFLTGGTCYQLPDSFLESERLANRYNELDDVVSTLGSGMLGITVACARCHDHKYDAFSAKDYYQLLGVFHSGDRVTGKLPSGKDGYYFKDFDAKRRTTWLFRRSDVYDREIELDFGFPAMLSSGADAEAFWSNAKEAYSESGDPQSTLQRRALAEWMTDTQQGGGALLARVMVNRVWHHHFGKGIVPTTGDFGVRGDAPSHPELIEYLTNEFVASGWKIKSLHRAILTSAVWQQASTREALDEHGAEIDPANRLLWRMTPQRLEVEILRDAMLAVTETLNLEAGGPGFKPYIAPEANQARNIQGEGYPKDAPDDASTRRRSVYMFHKRLIPYPMFQAFDRPDLMTSCARRQNTTVAPQAMVILNDRFVRSVAHDYAELLIKKQADSSVPATGELQPLIHRAFETSFARPPTEREIETSVQFIEAQAKARTERKEPHPRMEAVTDYCQSLFGLNEFIYVD